MTRLDLRPTVWAWRERFENWLAPISVVMVLNLNAFSLVSIIGVMQVPLVGMTLPWKFRGWVC